MASNSLRAISLALLVVLAGCASGASPVTEAQRTAEPNSPSPTSTAPETQTTTATATPEPSPTPTPTPPSTATANPTTEGNTSAVDVEAMTASERASIHEAITHAFEKVPENRTERLAYTAALAEQTCLNGTVNTSAVESMGNVSGASKRQLYRVKHVAATIQGFNSQIDTDQVQGSIETAGTIAKYATIIGTVNEYEEAACAFDIDNPESVEDYYLATTALTVELAFIQYGVAYRVSSKVTRMASHTSTFRMVQSKFGDDALSLLMSETYWLVNGQIATAQAAAFTIADEQNITLRNTSLNDSQISTAINQTVAVEPSSTDVLNASTAFLTESGTLVGNASDYVQNMSINETGDILNNTTVNGTLNDTADNLDGVVNNTTSNETISDSRDQVNQSWDELNDAWNESNNSKKIGCLSGVGESIATDLIKQISNPFSDGINFDTLVSELSDSDLEQLSSCLNESE